MHKLEASTTNEATTHGGIAGITSFTFTDGGSPAADAATAPAPEAAPAPAEATPATFDSLAHDVLAGQTPAEDPTPAHATPAKPAAAESEAGATPAEPAPASNEPTPEPEVGAAPADALADLANIARDDVPADLLPLYDRIMEQRRLQQADYTRKTTQIARTVDERVQEQVQAELARLGVTTPQQQAQPAQAQPAAPAYADPDAIFWSQELGERITLADALASDDPSALDRHIQQRTVIEGRRAAAEMMQYILPQVQGVQSTVEAQQAAAADQIVNQLVADNADLAAIPGGIDTLVGLVRDGYAPNLEAAAPMARNLLLGDQAIQQAVQLGQHIATESSAAIQANKEQFSVPSSSTHPVPGAPAVRGKSFDEIGAAVVANATADH